MKVCSQGCLSALYLLIQVQGTAAALGARYEIRRREDIHNLTFLRTYSSCLESLTITTPAYFGGAAPHGNDYVLLPTYVVYFRRHVVINHLI